MSENHKKSHFKTLRAKRATFKSLRFFYLLFLPFENLFRTRISKIFLAKINFRMYIKVSENRDFFGICKPCESVDPQKRKEQSNKENFYINWLRNKVFCVQGFCNKKTKVFSTPV